MVAAGSVRRQIEDALAHRVPGALSPRQRSVVPRVAFGVPEIDALLGGGLPVGAITEVIGSSCSGRTSFALAFIAEITCAGQTTAWIDVADALDPESAAAAGVDLNRQLWIRCGSDSKQPEGDLAQPSNVPGLLCGETRKNSPSGGGGSPHPRNEVHGMPEAIQAFLHRPEKLGTAESHYPSPITRVARTRLKRDGVARTSARPECRIVHCNQKRTAHFRVVHGIERNRRRPTGNHHGAGNYGEHPDLAQLPEGDKATYDALCKADTVGMFQVESRAQMASIVRNAPRRFYDIVVQVAIIRPGPIVGKMMHPYMRRRRKEEAITYPVESLRPVLERTLGVPLFQEQLLRMAMVVGGFTGTEAEELRKAVGMRRSWARMEVLMAKLRKGMAANNIEPHTQEAIVGSIQSFALYGFPESHAASFALIAYASAYFKVHYLAAFTCAMLNNQPMGFYMPAVLIKDSQRHGLRVKPIDVQVSRDECTVEHEPDGSLSLRLGLLYVKSLRRATAAALVAARETHGPFRSIEDLSQRVPALSRKDLAQLARIGALNWLDGVEHRRDALWQVAEIGRPAGPLFRVTHEDRSQVIAVSSSAWLGTSHGFSALRQMSTDERLVADYAGTGVTAGPHPLSFRRKQLRAARILSAAELHACPDKSYVTHAGAVIARQRPGTALGFIFLSLEDETGISNVIIHPDLYDYDRLLVTRGRFFLVHGRLQNQDGVVHVRAERLEELALGLEQLTLQSHDFH